MTVRGCVAMLAVAGPLVGTWACGGRTGILLFDESAGDLGNEAAAPDSGVADVASDVSLGLEASDGGPADAIPHDSTGDVAAEVSFAPEAGNPGDSGSQPPSCAPGGPGMTTCGPGGSGSDSCCTSFEVEDGTFYRTYANDGGGPTGEADLASVSGFRLDEYDVTVGRFRQFVNAWNQGAGYLPAAGTGKHAHLNGGLGLENSAQPGTYEPGWIASDDVYVVPTDDNLDVACSGAYGDAPFATWTASAGGQENLPINCVSWYEAYAFCIWDGGFLPSEAEWEYSAAGGGEQLEYPWGATDPGSDNRYAIYSYNGSADCYFPNGAACSSVANIARVGTASLGAGRWGQLDLSGELWQWNLDSYAPDIDPCTDCANFTTASRVIRGGSYRTPEAYLSPPFLRDFNFPTDIFDGFGVRCARTP